VRHVELVACLLQGVSAVLGLPQALLAEVGVEPAAEPVLLGSILRNQFRS
jgi:hypothetical protein